MFTRILVITNFLVLSLGLIAQNEPTSRSNYSWNENSRLISVGIGAPAYFAYYKIYTDRSAITSTLSNPITESVVYLKNEIALGKLGFGISLCRSVLKFDYQDQYFNGANSLNIKETVYSVNARFNHHFLMSKAFDPYIGAGVGLRIVNYNVDSTLLLTYNTKPIGIEVSVGFRYLIASRVGLYAECGFGRSLFQCGLTVNLGRKT